MPRAGRKAPDFTLASQDGTKFGPHDFKGKWIVLYFYPKDNTPGCTIEAHNFQQDLAKYEADRAVVGVSLDNAASHQDFCAKQGRTFKLLSDTDKKVVEEYGSLSPSGVASRNTFLINPKGEIVKVWTSVKPQGHSHEVLEALNEQEKK